MASDVARIYDGPAKKEHEKGQSTSGLKPGTEENRDRHRNDNV